MRKRSECIFFNSEIEDSGVFSRESMRSQRSNHTTQRRFSETIAINNRQDTVAIKSSLATIKSSRGIPNDVERAKVAASYSRSGLIGYRLQRSLDRGLVEFETQFIDADADTDTDTDTDANTDADTDACANTEAVTNANANADADADTDADAVTNAVTVTGTATHAAGRRESARSLQCTVR